MEFVSRTADTRIHRPQPFLSSRRERCPAFKRALADGTLPSVTNIDSREDVEDEHPTADVQVGEAWTCDIYEAVTTSPLWP